MRRPAWASVSTGAHGDHAGRGARQRAHGEELANALARHARLLAPADPETAAVLLGGGYRLRGPRTVSPAVAPVVDRATTLAREQLGTAAFERSYERGRTLDADELLDICTSL